MKKIFLLATVAGIGATIWFFMLPESYGTRLKGFVKAVMQGDGSDILIKFTNDKHFFRIAKGLDLDIDINKLKSKLIGKETIIYYTHPKWPISTAPYITRLICDGDLVYTKW